MGKNSIAPGQKPRKDNFTASELAEMASFDAALEAEEIFLTKEERALSAALDREALAEAETGDSPHPSASPTPSPQGKARTGETAERRAARLAKKAAYRAAHREQLRLSAARYNEAHRQERRDYQKTYDAAHKAEINAGRRARRAAKKRKEKEHG